MLFLIQARRKSTMFGIVVISVSLHAAGIAQLEGRCRWWRAGLMLET